MEFSYDLEEAQAEENNVSRHIWRNKYVVIILKPFDLKAVLNITNSTPLTSHIIAKKLPQTMFIGTFIRYVYSFSVNTPLEALNCIEMSQFKNVSLLNWIEFI